METFGQYTFLRPDEPLALRGLHVLVGGPERAPSIPARGKASDHQAKVDGFLAYARSTGLDITRQVVALEPDADGHQRIVGMALWVPAPGRTAMLFGPSQSEHPETAAATQGALAGVLADARNAGVLLVQAMLEPGDGAGKTVFASAGLTQLATLTYMERKPPAEPPSMTLPPGVTLEAYSPATHPLFRDTILASYEQTLDCPGLSGVRDIEDIIAGHKAVGEFDPQLWTLALVDGKPAGALLLGEIPQRRALELVYLGLAPAFRGQGLGKMLMHRVLGIAARRHFALATLAVDAANTPAAKLYRRFGYTSVAQRVAMIQKLV
jgi:mycothiol synthase